MNGFFSPNNLFFRSLSWAVDIVGISILWLFLSLPLVTLVPASAALYPTCALCVRRGESGAFSRFLRSFLGNLRQGCLLSLVVVPLGLLLLLGQNVMAAAAGEVGGYATALYGVYTAALFLPFGAACWLPPLLGRFDFPSRELWRTAFLLALGHLPTTLLAVLLTAGAAFACLLCFPLLFLLPVVLEIALSFPMERVFRKYMAK